MKSLVCWWPRLAAVVAVILLPSWLMAAPRSAKPVPEAVEMFSAMESGQIEVNFIPKDATEARLLVRNKTDKPLSIRLPEAFAGVPVLAQFDGGDGGGDFGGGGGGTQSVGGGGMGGMGGGMFNVPPEKVGKIKLPLVCLEHGKPDPRPAVKYQIKPIAEYTDNAEVQEVCRMLGAGMVSQRAAQVAAWHFANDMSWQELAGKRIEHVNGSWRPYFAPQEIQAGMKLAAAASRIAEQRKSEEKEKTPSLSEQ